MALWRGRPCQPTAHRTCSWIGEQPGSLFISISQEGDGRAPAGEATVIASVFTGAKSWFELEPAAYRNSQSQSATGH